MVLHPKSTYSNTHHHVGGLLSLEWVRKGGLYLTQNQVSYWRNVEQQRADLANEGIRRRENELKEQQLAETNRANLASEAARLGELSVKDREAAIKEYESQTNRARQLEDAKTAKVKRGTDIANSITGGLQNVTKSFQNVLTPMKGAADLIGGLMIGG